MFLNDKYDRKLDYLRVSVTDRCNFRCRYCMPAAGVGFFPSGELLTRDELLRLIKLFVSLGVKKIRFTGGEPLLRPDLVEIVEVSRHHVEDLSLTTNGVLLSPLAAALKKAGLKRVNISLDTLRGERFREITGSSQFGAVLEGIEAAVAAGLSPVKVNVVLMRGINEDEIEDFLSFAASHPIEVRFIELMPARNCFLWSSSQRVAVSEVLEKANKHYRLLPRRGGESDVAQLYQLEGGRGRVGLISPLSESLCRACNRLRLKANGMLQLCLHGAAMIDLRTPLRSGASEEELAALVLQGVWSKPKGHEEVAAQQAQSRLMMSQVGG